MVTDESWSWDGPPACGPLLSASEVPWQLGSCGSSSGLILSASSTFLGLQPRSSVSLFHLRDIRARRLGATCRGILGWGFEEVVVEWVVRLVFCSEEGKEDWWDGCRKLKVWTMGRRAGK